MKTVFDYTHYRELLDAFCDRIRAVSGENLISIVLYGSVARGTAHRESDVDVMVILRDTPSVYHERMKPALGAMWNYV